MSLQGEDLFEDEAPPSPNASSNWASSILHSGSNSMASLLSWGTGPRTGSSDNLDVDLGPVEEEKPEPVILEAALDMRRGARGAWKRHYVVLNLSDGGSITCHRATLHKRHPTKVDPIALQIAPTVRWLCTDFGDMSNIFMVQIPTAEGQTHLLLKQHSSESLYYDDDATVGPLDGDEVVKKNSYDKDFAKAKRSKKPLRYFFRFSHHSVDQKDAWLDALEDFERVYHAENPDVVHKLEKKYRSRFLNVSKKRDLGNFKAKSSSFTPPSNRRPSAMSMAAHEQAEVLAQKRGTSTLERFKVNPDYAYPNTRMDRDELRTEMNQPSAFYHDLRVPSRRGEEIGILKLEILQCFGLPKLDAIGETDGYGLAVCGGYAFKTDIIPGIPNPMWLSKMRRACIFPLFEAYARLYLAIFDDDGEGEKDDFAGRVVLDIARMRPNCTYDVTLPLRESGDVYMRRPRGSVRFRFHISWNSERAMMLSYLPKKAPKIEPNNSVLVNCCDKKSFQNTALAVHGTHMQGRFSMKLLKSLVREINFTRIHILRYLRKREVRNLAGWKNPVISGFVFVAWMHSVYENTLRYVPGHLITFLLLYLWKNYAQYAIDNPVQRGFLAPTWEEMLCALLWGNQRDSRCIEPLEMTLSDPSDQETPLQSFGTSTDYPNLEEIAKDFQEGVHVRKHRYRMKTYQNTFVGSSAVDFLVNRGHASSREEAVKIGRLLSKKLKLFEHIARQHEFKDARLFYHFLVHDGTNYELKTHEPWGRSLFQILGFLNENENFADDQLEMPYSTGDDHPRFTVQESLVIRSKESKSMIERLRADDDDDDAAELGMKGSLEQLSDPLQQSESIEDSIQVAPAGKGSLLCKLDSFVDPKDAPVSEHEEDDDANNDKVTVKQLKNPPLQNIDIKKKGDKPITDVLAEARHKVHGVLLHLFNDRTYVVKEGNARAEELSPKVSRVTKIKSKVGKIVASPAHLSKKIVGFAGSESKSTNSTGSKSLRKSNGKSDAAEIANPKTLKKSKSSVGVSKEDNDKLLKTGIHSNSNPWVAKVGVIIQPIIEIAFEWLCLFRALFNLFTWRDPILSFWVSIIGPVVVLVLHFFPWRILMGVAGLALFGPQNWVFRVIRERKGIFPPDMDTIVRKKKKKKDDVGEPEEEPLFINSTFENEPLDYSTIDQSEVRHIVVPHSQLMYSHRFYDWPPEPDYARVKADSPDEMAKGWEAEESPRTLGERTKLLAKEKSNRKKKRGVCVSYASRSKHTTGQL